MISREYEEELLSLMPDYTHSYLRAIIKAEDKISTRNATYGDRLDALMLRTDINSFKYNILEDLHDNEWLFRRLKELTSYALTKENITYE